jgi:uncharacterized protein YkwD
VETVKKSVGTLKVAGPGADDAVAERLQMASFAPARLGLPEAAQTASHLTVDGSGPPGEGSFRPYLMRPLGGALMMNVLHMLPTGRRLLAALLVPLAALSATAPPATALTARTALVASPAMRSGSYEHRVQHWINVRRAHHGLRALRFSACADRAAERWGAHLALTDTFVHQSMWTIMNRCDARYAGETLGRGAITPKHLVRLWMHSPPHRAVLLSRHPRRIGIGAYPNLRGEWVVAADFMRF